MNAQHEDDALTGAVTKVPARTMIIGDLPRWRAEGRDVTTSADFHFAAPEDISLETLHGFAPEIILSPLFGDTFDVIDVATTLHELGFRGQYRAIVASRADVSDEGVIRGDVSAVAPDLDFDLLVLTD